MQNAIAFADNDIVVVAWSYGHKLPTCMGFAVHRIDEDGNETPLPSMAVFPGTKRKPGQTTDEFPVQKFYWKDPYARLVADKTGKRKFRYKVVPLEGKVGALKPMAIGFAVSNEIEVTPHLTDDLEAYFNRGIISTQHVAEALGGMKPSKGKLLTRVADQTDSLRKDLAGDMIEALTGFVSELKADGELYCALYELGDQQLIDVLKTLKKRLHVVLSNPKASDEQSQSGETDGNVTSREDLKDAGAEVIDRMLPDGQIGHNKFAVQVKKGKPVAVLFGSTNWTSTGLCTQTNNTIIWRDAGLAKRYLDYWKQLTQDTETAVGDPKALQATPLRTWDAKSKTLKVGGEATVTSWFSPNTPAKRKSNTANEKRPPDMDELATLMLGAKQAILFLAFYPGSPSLANWAAQAQKANEALFVRGCVTNPSAAEGFVYELKGTTPPKKQKGDPSGPQDPRVIAAKALDNVVPEGWKNEILNAGFAVTHDKIVVIDPFSDDCFVVTGSHNLGHKASFNNDENLVIVKGQRALAEAYATHVLDIYDHFSWRWMVQRDKAKADASLKVKPDEWQSRYFNDDGTIKAAQLRFWLSALPSS
jgi:phosphatidylserine/phosphatidylglycerophosphate/cardiolipin synthase-like enzyme